MLILCLSYVFGQLLVLANSNVFWWLRSLWLFFEALEKGHLKSRISSNLIPLEKSLAGTRAGKQYYLAFDTELVIQSGCRLFRTNEAIISPDWISNENLICSYDSINREFSWVNRPYELTRNGYNNQMKKNRDQGTTKSEALSVSPYAKARANLKLYLESGKHVRPGEMTMTTKPEELPPLTRRREGQNGPFEDSVTLKTDHF